MGSPLRRLAQEHKAVHAGTERPGPLPPVAISVCGVGYSYTKRPFIEDFSLDIPHGKITSIVGPNGCGKSTLLKIIDGLIVPHAGEVLIDGRPSLAMGGKERARHLALLTQGAQAPAMSVEALVACGRYPYQGPMRHRDSEKDKEHVEEAMVLAKVEQFRHQDVRYLSGGERQRAFIAMTLAQDTGIIALDEPTSYLDVRACHEVMQLVEELNTLSDKTILMVMHDLDLALRYSDYIVVMERGRYVYQGGTSDAATAKAIESAFQVEVCRFPSEERVAYALFPFDGK